MLALASPAESDQAATHIMRGWYDAATGAGRLALDNDMWSNKGPSWWDFGHCPFLHPAGEPFEPKFLHRIR